MDWKFWNKASTPAPGTSEWPTDTYEALRRLLGMLMRADTPPFSSWNAPGVVFAPNVENPAQSATKGYQLALWFWVFAEKHGVVAARMARDTFCLLADEVQPSTGDVLDNLIELENRLIQSFDATPIEQRSFVQSGQAVELPMEFFLATGFLLQAPDSPYYGRSSVDFEGNDIKLASCLRSATEQALPLFKPMVQAIEGFDARALPRWKWSASPGAMERHLQRRYNNPLFPLHRQVVTSSDVYEARVADYQALADIRVELAELAREFYGLTELPVDWHPLLNGLRERLDKLEEYRLMAGGENESLGGAIAELRDKVMEIWRSALHNNAHQLATLEEAETVQRERRAALYATDWMRQLRSHASPIPPQEVVAALLSDTPTEIERAVAALQAESQLHSTLENCRSYAHRLVAEVRAAGHTLPDIDEKLRILGENYH
ncbi:tryptophan leader peptide [Caballeronia sp.]|uniref:tryptophan leader peptide n=1 Tax=Caballeronia sp. TaxID=1931223 RepID=UPI003C53A6C1